MVTYLTQAAKSGET